MPKVSFSGNDKLITINTGIRIIDVKRDLYYEWKNWIIQGDNSAFLPAFRVVGGEELQTNYFLTPTFFLTNGWRIKPSEENHTLNVRGNIYVDGSSDSPFADTIGPYNVRVNLTTSNIVNTVAGTGSSSGITTEDKEEISNSVISALQPDIKRIMGLVHHNFKFYLQNYDQNGNLLSGKVKLFETSSDCANNINPIATYSISCSYDENKKLNDYIMKVD